MYYPRIFSNLESYLKPNKVLVIYGPRQVGKTTLLNHYLKTSKWKYKVDSGDILKTQHTLGSQDLDQIKAYAAGYDLLVIDEAQFIPKIGLGLKILVDHLPNIRIIATGSSSFDLANKLGEPLTGRKRTLTLYPLSQLELTPDPYNHYELKEHLAKFLIFGSYPEVLKTSGKQPKVDVIDELINSYLLKDLLALEQIKGSQVIFSILKLLAFQIGSQVSLNEIATTVNLDIKTVQRYLDLLEKTFVIKRLGGYSRNLREEVTSKSKYYFFDTGVRNGIIRQFNDLDYRDDIGKLWENFLVMERLKFQAYRRRLSNNYFWRTWDQQEVDWVEERDGKLFGFEFSYSPKKSGSPPLWLSTYQEATYQNIHTGNYLSFLT